MPLRALVAALIAAAVVAIPTASAHRLPKAPSCPVLPKSNAFNQRVDRLPVASNSQTLVTSSGAGARLHADFGSGTYDGGPTAGSGAIFDLRSNRLRPAGWTSADAAGLPILPGLARYHEVAKGSIDHALRFTARRTRRAYVYPARHFASSDDDPALPPMGLRVRLKAGVSIDGLGQQAKVVAGALQRYGALLADNGSPWYFSGAPDRRWDNDDLHTLDRLTGADFEVVDTSSLPKPR